MKKIFILILVYFLPVVIYAQEIEKLPRKKAFSQKPGSYNLAIRISKPIVDPGEQLQIEIYISGYGIIEASKLACYPSLEVFDVNKSIMRYGLQKVNGEISFGGQKRKISPIGQIISLTGGIQKTGWKKSTMFFDASNNEGWQISTEVNQKGYAPMSLNLTLKDSARPGPQSIQFIFSYFNGETWISSPETAQFTIRNFYQRHEVKVWIIGAIASIMAILLGFKELLLPLLKRRYLKYIDKNKKLDVPINNRQMGVNMNDDKNQNINKTSHIVNECFWFTATTIGLNIYFLKEKVLLQQSINPLLLLSISTFITLYGIYLIMHRSATHAKKIKIPESVASIKEENKIYTDKLKETLNNLFVVVKHIPFVIMELSGALFFILLIILSYFGFLYT
ncbi:MAG: hypothetical protein KAI43_12835 [Candidatus Aureabacteria bacterium]|nr:hypothetical protein [Candidatus Auribacterota bacterium]